MPAKLTIEEIRTKGLERGFKLLSNSYVNTKTKLTWECPDGHVIERCFGNISQGTGCFVCAGNQKLTLEEVKAEGLKLGLRLQSSTYVNALTKIEWMCPNGHTFLMRYNNLTQKQGCPICANDKKRMTLEEVRNVGLKHGFELLSTSYTNNHKKLQWRCQSGHITWKNFGTVSLGIRCGVCSDPKLTLEYVRTIGLKYGFKLLSTEYLHNKANLRWECSNGHITCKNFNNTSQGAGCFVCLRKREKSQIELYQYILSMYPDALSNEIGLLESPRLELDIYVPSLKKAIELDGEYWHSKPEAKERDARKNEECLKAGIKLLRLSYTKHWHRKNKDIVGKAMVLEFLSSSGVCSNSMTV